MLWPTPADYVQAVSGYPDVCLLDPKLKGGKLKKNPMNQLLVYTGGFSTVFPIEVVHNKHALRCWNKDIGDSKNRYEKINDYLKQVNLPYFVDFEYVPDGILINGKKWPITRMEWVNGETLRNFIEHNLHDSNIFVKVADEFREMFKTLHVHNISHGDLQSGNIILRNNGSDIIIKLIDYDSLFVPDLRGQKSPTPGLPEYQHPSRIDRCDEKMDYFSELVIYLSFLSLSEKPDLWNQNKDKTEKGLLFSKQDFENPDRSDIFQQLNNLSFEIQQLAAALKDYCNQTSLDQLKPLEAILPKPDAKSYTDRGFNHLNNNRYNKAISEFQNAIDLNPNYNMALYGLGLSYLHCNRYDEAIKTCEEVVYIDPNFKEGYYALGLSYIKSGNNSKAKVALNEAIKIDPHYQLAKQLLDTIKPPPDPPLPVPGFWDKIRKALASHWQTIAIASLAIGLIICSIVIIQQSKEKDKFTTEKTNLKRLLAQKESDSKNMNTSIQTLETKNESLRNKNKTLQEKLSSMTTSDEESEHDIVSLQRQLNEQKLDNRQLQSQLNKKDIEIRNLQTTESGNTKKITGLESQIEEKNEEINKLNEEISSLNIDVEKIQLKNTNLLSEKLVLQTNNKKLEKLNERLNTDIASLRQQSINRNRNTAAKNNEIERREIKPQQVSVVLEPPTEIDDNNADATLASANYNNTGLNAFKRNEYEKAIVHFKQAVRADENFALSHYNLGCAYFKNKDYMRAITAFSDAIKKNPKSEKAYYNRSLSLFMIMSKQEAKRDAEKALSINRSYQRAIKLLERIQQSSN